MEVKVVRTDEDLIKVLPLVVKFRMEVDYSLKQILYDVGRFDIMVYVEGDKGMAEAYAMGNYTSPTSFFISQVYSPNMEQTPILIAELERLALGDADVMDVDTAFKVDPKVLPHYLEKYGYKYKRTFISKTLKKEV